MKGKPIVILLVEDDFAHAEIVRRNLANFPVAHRLFHVEDGQMALDYLFQKNSDPRINPRPDLILLDLRLPKVDGIEVLRQIKENKDLERIPTVVLTTSANGPDLAAARSLGAMSYQVKPANFEGFTELMETNFWLADVRRTRPHE